METVGKREVSGWVGGAQRERERDGERKEGGKDRERK